MSRNVWRLGSIGMARALAVVTAMAVSACGGGGGGGGAAETASLEVNITGLPAGSSASVAVTGPGGYSGTLTSTTTLTGLAPGSYTFTPQSVFESGGLVDNVYTAAAATVEVQAGVNPPVTLGYAQREGSGLLWLSITNTGLRAYGPAELAASGTPAPVHDGGGWTVYGMAFDRAGNLWGVQRRLYRFQPSTLVGTRVADLEIRLTGDNQTTFWGIAIDAEGNAWVAAYRRSGVNQNKILMFRKDDLASSSATPYLTVTSSDLNAPIALAFDRDGNLWAANDGDSSVMRLGRSDLAGSGEATVAAACRFATPSAPQDLAFDFSGNLWVAGAAALYRYDAADLAGCTGSASVTAARTLTGAAVKTPYGLAFDNGRNLWVTNLDGAGPNRFLAKIAADDLAGGGAAAVDPAVRIELTEDVVYRPAFNPPPPGLPLVR